MAFVVGKVESIQYNGINGAAVVDWVDNATLVSDNGTTLKISIPDVDNFTFTANDHWLLRVYDFSNRRFGGFFDDAEYRSRLIELP